MITRQHHSDLVCGELEEQELELFLVQGGEFVVAPELQMKEEEMFLPRDTSPPELRIPLPC